MISIAIVLLSYGAAYTWLYKPRYGYYRSENRRGMGKGVVHLIFRPIAQLDAERIKQKRQHDVRVFCQGNWQGTAIVRDVENRIWDISYQVSIVGDTLTITSATHDCVLVGKMWKINPYEHYTMLRKEDYAENSTAALRAFSDPLMLSSPDRVFLPWFPFYESPMDAGAVVVITGEHPFLERVAP